MKREPRSLLVFAHIPPPEHGQSRMVAEMLDALEGRLPVVHVDARFSEGMADVGRRRVGKFLRMLGYLRQALAVRWRGRARSLYYVPGPVKWSAVVRDWIVLGSLRPWFPDLILHWHAIGQGEWAHGGERCRLSGPGSFDRMARWCSKWVLRRPSLSMVVSPASDADARAVASGRVEVVCNGIVDPCPEYERTLAPLRRSRAEELQGSELPEIRVLFLAHGTEQKGLFDALVALEMTAGRVDGRLRIAATFAGGVAEGLRDQFGVRLGQIHASVGRSLSIDACGYVSGDQKARCYSDADLFLMPSRWESFGLTVIEAMAWGLPVVAAASDGVRGVLSDGYEWLAPPGDQGKLAAALEMGVRAISRGEGPALGDRLREEFVERFRSESFHSRIRRVLVDHCGNPKLSGTCIPEN